MTTPSEYFNEGTPFQNMKKTNEPSPSTDSESLGITKQSADGHSVDGDDMHWTVACPVCEKEFEYEGFFDSSDVTKCKCGTEFKTRRVYFDDGGYIE
jgi:hypothetical protein